MASDAPIVLLIAAAVAISAITNLQKAAAKRRRLRNRANEADWPSADEPQADEIPAYAFQGDLTDADQDTDDEDDSEADIAPPPIVLAFRPTPDPETQLARTLGRASSPWSLGDFPAPTAELEDIWSPKQSGLDVGNKPWGKTVELAHSPPRARSDAHAQMVGMLSGKRKI